MDVVVLCWGGSQDHFSSGSATGKRGGGGEDRSPMLQGEGLGREDAGGAELLLPILDEGVIRGWSSYTQGCGAQRSCGR